MAGFLLIQREFSFGGGHIGVKRIRLSFSPVPVGDLAAVADDLYWTNWFDINCQLESGAKRFEIIAIENGNVRQEMARKQDLRIAMSQTRIRHELDTVRELATKKLKAG